jgi:hypothetical protein
MRAWGLSTINIGEFESQLAWGKRKFMWEKRRVFTTSFWDNKREHSIGA